MTPPLPTRQHRLLKVRTVSEMTDLSISTVRRLLKTGSLREIKIGKSVRITETSVLELIEAGCLRGGRKLN